LTTPIRPRASRPAIGLGMRSSHRHSARASASRRSHALVSSHPKVHVLWRMCHLLTGATRSDPPPGRSPNEARIMPHNVLA